MAANITLSKIVETLDLSIECCGEFLNRHVTGGYASDLLSDVMANTKKGDIWVTLQGHPNTIAVAALKELSGIILINGRKPEQETIKRAAEEKCPIFTTDLPAFEVIGKLYELGISGKR